MSDTPDLSAEVRLERLGFTLPEAPPPAAIYQPFMRSGDRLWIAGQIAMRDGQLMHHGVVGHEITLGEAQTCAQQCALNLLAQMKSALGDLERIERVVKLNVFVSSAPAFIEQHLVANSASELMGAVFGERGKHARSAVGVSALPLGSPVEIDAVIEIKPSA
jgi:enamine deaminase RidA (YjgF/YER057c/UK114 family)